VLKLLPGDLVSASIPDKPVNRRAAVRHKKALYYLIKYRAFTAIKVRVTI
jgi:hypothetical protein